MHAVVPHARFLSRALRAVVLPVFAAAVFLAGPSLATAQSPSAQAPGPEARALAPSAADLVTRAGANLTGVFDGAASVADVDGENGADLLIAGEAGQQTGDRKVTTLYLRQDDGRFAAAQAGLTDVGEAATAIADVDGQNGPDLLVAGEADETSRPTTTLYLQQPDGGFAPAQAGLEGVERAAVDIADVDGQNGPDLLVTGEAEDASATLYLQQPDGSFDPAQAGLAGVTGGTSVIADVDGQNGPDLLITGDNRTKTTVYLQQPDGSFSGDDELIGGLAFGYGTALSIGDVDGENGPDVLLAEGRRGRRDATLYLQQPGGGFARAGAGLPAVSDPMTAIADVDGQNGPDLIVAGNTDSGPTAAIFQQQSDGSFSRADAGLTGVDGGVSAGGLATGDVGGDGDTDLLLTGQDVLGLTRSPSARLYVNRTVQSSGNRSPRAAGTAVLRERTAPGLETLVRTEFGDPDGDRLSLSVSGSPAGGSVTITDAGNGVGEVAVAPPASQAGRSVSFTVEASDGNGATASTTTRIQVPEVFAATGASLTGAGRAATSIADVDGQNGADLLVAGTAPDGTPAMTLYLQQSDGTFAAAGASAIADVDQAAIATGDVDGQNGPDVLVAGLNENDTETTALYLQQADGSFAPANAGLPGIKSGAVSIADVDEENGPDLLVAGSKGPFEDPVTALYLQQGDGTFDKAGAGFDRFGFAEKRTALSVADVDGENGPDVLLAGNSNRGGDAVLYLQQSDGSFAPANAGLDGGPNGAATIADVDGENGPDLLIGDNSETRLYRQQPDGSFESAAEFGALFPASGTGAISVADANGDAAPDVFITGPDGTGGASRLFLQQPGGDFAPARAGLPGAMAGATSVADVTGDGNVDLLLAGARPGFGGSSSQVGTTLLENTFGPAVAAETEQASGPGEVAFRSAGAAIDFASGTSGSGPVRVVKYGRAPRQTPGIPSGTRLSRYRFTVETAPGLNVGAGTRLRFDVSTLAGTPNPGDIDVYRRNPPGDGFFGTSPGSSSFSKIPAANVSYDDASNELVVTTGTFSEFVFASGTNPLPVNLAGLEATANPQSVRLTWQTASEQSNAGFAVQRKAFTGEGPAGWRKVGFVGSKAAQGTSSEANRYRFVDEGLPFAADSVRYRLRQVDADGSTSLSKTVTVARPVDRVRLLNTAPNPAREAVRLRFAVPERTMVTAELYDALGRRVKTVHRGRTQGRVEARIDVSGLASGVYVLQLTAGEQAASRRLTVVQ
jgi:hypothetical protein